MAARAHESCAEQQIGKNIFWFPPPSPLNTETKSKPQCPYAHCLKVKCCWYTHADTHRHTLSIFTQLGAAGGALAPAAHTHTHTGIKARVAAFVNIFTTDRRTDMRRRRRHHHHHQTVFLSHSSVCLCPRLRTDVCDPRGDKYGDMTRT